MSTSAPPTQALQGTKATTYDPATPAGGEANKLLATWLASTTPDMQAPWRQTGGGGGSEFGKPRWHTTLQAAYKPQESPPVYKLWQLALAVHVVRRNAPATPAV